MRAATIDDRAAGAAGFTLVGEPVAVDLVNSEKRATKVPVDLLPNEEANRTFWHLETKRTTLPAAVPSLADVRTLRTAIRSLLESRLDHATPASWAVDTVNRFSSEAPISARLAFDWTGDIESHANDDGAALLGWVARSAVELVSGTKAERLRRCAADDCSMLFVATNAKRQWCTSAGCGNRQRVARFADRQRA